MPSTRLARRETAVARDDARSSGNANVVWLDHRNMAAAHEAHEADASSHGTRDGAAMAERSGLYIARVTGNAVEPERQVTSGSALLQDCRRCRA